MSASIGAYGARGGDSVSNKGIHIALWVVQALLALAFGAAGLMKLSPQMDPKNLGGMSLGLVRFIGIAELAGALGMILPSATRILPRLTSVAGVGISIIMVLATAFHVSRSEWSHIPVTLILGGMAAFVAWGRFRKASITPR